MAPEAQLEWEARTGRLAAAGAFVTAALIVAANLLRGSALDGSFDDERESLIAFGEAGSGFALSALVQAAGHLAFAGVLFYLFRAVSARRPQTPGWTLPLVLLGTTLLAVGRVLTDLDLLDLGDRFLDSGERTEKRAEDLLEERSLLGVALLQGGVLALGLSLVVLNVNAMRAGVLSRFMGILGIIVGALYVLPLLAGPFVIQLFWTVALGALFLGYWPGGRGPAWETGEATPWPTAAERAEARMGAAQAADPAAEPTDAEPAAERPPSRKRKRKRR